MINDRGTEDERSSVANNILLIGTCSFLVLSKVCSDVKRELLIFALDCDVQRQEWMCGTSERKVNRYYNCSTKNNIKNTEEDFFFQVK